MLENKGLIFLLGWSETQRDRFCTVVGDEFVIENAHSWKDLSKESRANLDVILVLVANEHFNPLSFVDSSQREAPLTQIAFFGHEQIMRQIRQRLILVRALGTHWTFINQEQPTTWIKDVTYACLSTRKRRAMTSISPFKFTEPVARTKQTRVEATPSESQQAAYFSSVIRYAREAILFLDLYGKICFCNRAAEELYRFPKQQILGTNISQLITSSAQEEHAEVINNVIVLKGDFLLQINHVTYEGQNVPVEESLAPVKDWRGLITGVMIIVRDISERLEKERLEKERLVQEQTQLLMEATNADLERRVAERTVELRALNRELESFSYSVSHDLRTPLRAINSFSQILQDKYVSVLDPQGQNYFSRIRAAAQRMSELIDDILLLAKVTRVDMTLNEVHLSAIATAVIADLLEVYPQYQNIKFDIEPHIVVTGDGNLLKVVIENLISNAAKFSHKQEQPRIIFGCKRNDGKNIYFIQDNGVGFDIQYSQKLFAPFQRLHGINEFEGTGIGLATVKRIIERHGGQVWAESEASGATFFFNLN